MEQEDGRARAQIEAASLTSVFAAFPEDVTIAMQQAADYNRAVAAQRASPLFQGIMLGPEWRR